MRVALIQNPYYHQKYMENLDFVSNNFGVFPPLGLMYVSSILKEEGHKTEIIDPKAENIDKKEACRRLKKFDPDIIGVMIIPYTARIALEWAEYMKENFEVPIVAGNYAMIHYPKAVVSNDFIDFGIQGSARKTLPELLKAIDNDKKNFEDIEGLVYKRKGEVMMNNRKEIKEDLDKLPWPDRESLNNNLYHSMASKRKPFTILVTSYGCTFNCDFCDMRSFGYAEREPEDVVDEIEYCITEHGIKEMDIFDRDFLIDKRRSKKICREIIERGLNITWSCRSRVDQVDEQTLKLMKRAGCRLILFGIESGDQKILNTDHKGISISQIREGIKLTKKAGIETLGFFIIGHPGETTEEIQETINFAKELPLDYAQFFKMSGKPGAKLYDELTREIGYDFFDKLIRGEVEPRKLPRPWTDLENEEIEKWVLKAYKKFYLRPSYILKRILKVNSFEEFVRYAKTGLKILKKIN